jgi:pyridoxamine 5'-phosphate oxidase family protein
VFTEKELAYIRSQPLARLATVNEEGQPDVAAVAFEFDGEAFYVGGMYMTSSRKYKNAVNAEPKVALIIDDMTFDAAVGEPPTGAGPGGPPPGGPPQGAGGPPAGGPPPGGPGGMPGDGPPPGAMPTPRGIRIYGTAESVERVGRFGPATMLKITPTVSWSWSLEAPMFVEGKFITNRTVH